MINTHVWQPGCFTKLSVLSRCDWTLGVLSGVVLFRWREEENIQIVFSRIRRGFFYQGWSDDVTYPVSLQNIQLITAVSPYYIWLFRLHLSSITKKIIWEIMTHCSLGLFGFFFFHSSPFSVTWICIFKPVYYKDKFWLLSSPFKSYHFVCKFVLKIWEKYNFSPNLLHFTLCKL